MIAEADCTELSSIRYRLMISQKFFFSVYRMIQRAFRSGHIDINCVDSFGRGAINLAIEAENLEMLEMLVVMGVGPKDNLLHAINAEFVEAVELLLQYEELVHTEGEPYVSADCETYNFLFNLTCKVVISYLSKI